jgi:hypothetical protein
VCVENYFHLFVPCPFTSGTGLNPTGPTLTPRLDWPFCPFWPFWHFVLSSLLLLVSIFSSLLGGSIGKVWGKTNEKWGCV